MVDPRRDEPADQVGPAVQVNQLVLAAPTGDLWPRRRRSRLVIVAAWGREGVDEDLDLTPEPGAVPLEPDRLLDGQQLVQALPLERCRDIVGEARRRRPRPLRVGGGENLVVADRLEEAKGRSELLVGLAAEADDDVGR